MYILAYIPVQVNRMFGAKKFQFYVESWTPELESCLKKYQQLGIVDVQPWSLPGPLLRPGVSPGFTNCYNSQYFTTGLKPICPTNPFYPRDAMLARVIAIATCLSVCPSVTRRYCVKTKKSSVMISSLPGSPNILVF